ASFGKLKFRPPADDPYPLGWRCATSLFFEHLQRQCQGWHAVPAQFHVEVQSPPNQMDVGVVEAGDDPPALDIDPAGLLRGAGKQLFAACGDNSSASYCHC